MSLEYGSKKIRKENSNENHVLKNIFSDAVIVSAGVKKGTTKADLREELSEQLKSPVKASIGERIDSKTKAALMQAFFGAGDGLAKAQEISAEM